MHESWHMGIKYAQHNRHAWYPRVWKCIPILAVMVWITIWGVKGHARYPRFLCPVFFESNHHRGPWRRGHRKRGYVVVVRPAPHTHAAQISLAKFLRSLKLKPATEAAHVRVQRRRISNSGPTAVEMALGITVSCFYQDSWWRSSKLEWRGRRKKRQQQRQAQK